MTRRYAPMAPRLKFVEIDGQQFPCCRGCGTPIRRKDGSPALSRSWCGPECVESYMARRSSAGLRKATFRRDHGICADCGRECAVEVTRKEAMVKAWGETYVRRGFWRVGDRFWREVFAWAADHIVPIVDGGSLEMDNVQTLCDPCHARKTAEEARRRAALAREQARIDSDQMSLDFGGGGTVKLGA